jgi:hypothetical protein
MMSTAEEIEKIVRERVEDAKRKRIREKALEIVNTLGRHSLPNLLSLATLQDLYCDNKIKIKVDYSMDYLQIKARQENGKFKLVFYMENKYDSGYGYYTLHNIKCYIPGEWENHLESLWYEAEQRKLNKLKENFGIQ